MCAPLPPRETGWGGASGASNTCFVCRHTGAPSARPSAGGLPGRRLTAGGAGDPVRGLAQTRAEGADFVRRVAALEAPQRQAEDDRSRAVEDRGADEPQTDAQVGQRAWGPAAAAGVEVRLQRR